MALDSLQEFIAAIEQTGELVRVREPVRTRLEIAEVADRCMKSPAGGPALIFEHPIMEDGRASRIPVAINLFGSMRRICLALGVDKLDDVGCRISELLETKVPRGFMEKLALLPRLAELAKFPPRTRGGRPSCQEVVQQGGDVDLGRLPFLVTWPGDGGRYITLPLVITEDPARGIRNVGIYRIQVLGRNELAMHWQRHKVGAAHWREMAARGERMPVVIAIGGDPASVYSGSAPLPPTIDEFLFAGFLRRSPVELAKAVTCDLAVPAEAEIVIEGYVDPAEPLVLEGPFGDHTGFYSLADDYPKVHVMAVTMRKEPVYPATLVGRPPMEDYYLGHATERIFLPLLRLTVPEIVDYHMPAPGIFHNLVFVAIDKQYPGQAHKVMNALWGQGLMSLAKVIVVVDKGVNVQDSDEAWWVALNNIDPERDVRFSMGPMDVLDHSSRGFTYGSKMGIDATRKWPEEGFTREWPERIEMDAETKGRVDEMWGRLGIKLSGQ
ncbi:MAG TPA: menaquinone biosynthesis decarboxylase [Gemmatimonadales bacterium]|nr:menaquinone biosynthesis decarboxylase [Gemmatimonadales bacterium]